MIRPIVFLHGFLGTKEDWNAVRSYLPGRLCYALDLPGHNKNPADAPLPEFSEPVHLVGYSLGGRIAANLPRKNIASLTLLAAHPGLLEESEKQLRWQSDLAWAQKLRSVDDFLTDWYNQPIFGGFRPPDALRPLQDRNALAEVLLRYSLAKMAPLDLTDCSVCVGARDAKLQSVYKKLGKEVFLIPDAGHILPLENPKAVAAFLSERCPP